MIETKIVELTLAKIKEVDERAMNTMADGMLQNFGEYRYSAGYRKGLADAKLLLEETQDEIMKE